MRGTKSATARKPGRVQYRKVLTHERSGGQWAGPREISIGTQVHPSNVLRRCESRHEFPCACGPLQKECTKHSRDDQPWDELIYSWSSRYTKTHPTAADICVSQCIQDLLAAISKRGIYLFHIPSKQHLVCVFLRGCLQFLQILYEKKRAEIEACKNTPFWALICRGRRQGPGLSNYADSAEW